MDRYFSRKQLYLKWNACCTRGRALIVLELFRSMVNAQIFGTKLHKQNGSLYSYVKVKETVCNSTRRSICTPTSTLDMNYELEW